MMFNHSREIEEWIVVAGVLPIQKPKIGRHNKIVDDKVVVTTAQVLWKAHSVDNGRALFDDAGV